MRHKSSAGCSMVSSVSGVMRGDTTGVEAQWKRSILQGRRGEGRHWPVEGSETGPLMEQLKLDTTIYRVNLEEERKRVNMVCSEIQAWRRCRSRAQGQRGVRGWRRGEERDGHVRWARRLGEKSCSADTAKTETAWPRVSAADFVVERGRLGLTRPRGRG